MTNNLKSIAKYAAYKEVPKKRALECYYANKEVISQKRKDKYKQLPTEDKRKLQEYGKQWFNKQTPEKQLELKQKARKYHKNIYDDIMIRTIIENNVWFFLLFLLIFRSSTI